MIAYLCDSLNLSACVQVYKTAVRSLEPHFSRADRMEWDGERKGGRIRGIMRRGWITYLELRVQVTIMLGVDDNYNFSR